MVDFSEEIFNEQLHLLCSELWFLFIVFRGKVTEKKGFSAKPKQNITLKTKIRAGQTWHISAPSTSLSGIWSSYDKHIIKQNKNLCFLFDTTLQGNQILRKKSCKKTINREKTNNFSKPLSSLEKKNWKKTEAVFV